MALEKLNISGGRFLTLNGSFAKGNKDTPLSLRKTSLYLVETHYARKMNVILYDTKDRRGWFIDGASALLHLTRTQLSTKPYKDARLFKLQDFHHANPKDGADAALNALVDDFNRGLPLLDETKKWLETVSIDNNKRVELKSMVTPWRFEDLVRDTWNILEQIQDHQIKLLTDSKIELRGTLRDQVEGFGFRDIVEGVKLLRPRVAILEPSGKGWVQFSRKIGAITLLGTGFGEIIRPAEDANHLCDTWKLLPKMKDYLAVCTSTLDAICTQTGNRDEHPPQITQGIYWDKGPKLYEPCSGCKPDACDRVQVLLTRSLGSKTHPKPFDKPFGAVVFGRSANYNWRWRKRKRTVESINIPNGSQVVESSNGDSKARNHASSQNAKISGLTSVSQDPLDARLFLNGGAEGARGLEDVDDHKGKGKATEFFACKRLPDQLKSLSRQPRLFEQDESD